MKKITDLMLKLNEIDFKTHGAYKRYKTKHKMRPTTKVTIGGKTTTAGEADKVVAKADAIKRGAPETDPKALDQLAKVGMKSKAKSVDDYVVKDGDDFYIDSTDIDTGDAIAEPGEEVTFTQDGVEYTGTVSDEAEGRDDDVLKLDNVLTSKEKSEFGAKQKGIGVGGDNLPGPTSDENSVSGDAAAEKKVLEKLKTITKDNDVDLCSISVPGTNLFCAGNKQIPRDEMPQLKSKVVPGGKADELVKAGKLEIDAKNGEVNTEGLFKTMLEKEGITMKDPEPRQVTSLKATQNQLVGSKVNMFAKVLAGDQPFEGKELPKEDLQKWQDALREPVIVSKDGYILDGHHRWAALVQHDIANGGSGDVEMDVKEVDMGATELVDKTNKFTNDMGLQVKSAGKKAKKEGTMKLAQIIEEELITELKERNNPNDGKAAPYGSGYNKIDEDGHMDIPSAIRKCKIIIDSAQDIMEKLSEKSKEEDNLPTWWMDKVTLATDYINKADDYINNSGQINDANINEGRPMPMDTPNEFAYTDFKKWTYQNRTAVKNILIKALNDNRGDGTYLFLALTQVWLAWARKKAKDWTGIPVTPVGKKNFGRALAVMMKKDNLVIKRAGNKLTTVEGKLNEMDINDPILVAIRARKADLKKKAALPKVKRISTKQYYKLMDKESDIIDQMKDAAKEYQRLDSEMNQDAGQKGSNWTDADANRYGGDLNKLQTRIEKLAKQKLAVKKQIMNYRVN